MELERASTTYNQHDIDITYKTHQVTWWIRKTY
jgi:hypothetical protein